MLAVHQAAPAFQRILPEYSVVVYQGILIQIWRITTSLEGVRLVRETLAQFADQIQVTVVIIEDGATRPDKHARAELEILGKELAPRFAAVVYEGHGFAAAAVRAVMTSIGLFTRSALPSRIFSSVSGAVDWMRRTYPDVAGIDSVEAYLGGLRTPIPSGQWPRRPAK